MAKKQIEHEIELARTYRFCGNGMGVPGLPHEVTAAQAEELGLLDTLKAAIANGNYAAADEPVAETTEEKE